MATRKFTESASSRGAILPSCSSDGQEKDREVKNRREKGNETEGLVVDPQGQGLFLLFFGPAKDGHPTEKNEHENDVIMKRSARARYPTGGMEAVRFTWNITELKSVEIFKERHGGTLSDVKRRKRKATKPCQR